MLVAAAALAYAGNGAGISALLLLLPTGLLVLFAIVAGSSARRAYGAQNWLMTANDERIRIKFRSYLNTTAPADVPCVVELRRGDIVGSRIVRSRLTGHNVSGEQTHDRTVFVDIALQPSLHTTLLAAALRTERERRVRDTLWRHYPLTMPDDRTLRVEWRGPHSRTKPDAEEALRTLALFGASLPSQTEEVHLGTTGGQPQSDDIAGDIRALAERGRIIEATTLAARGFGMSTTEARRYVESLIAPK